MIIINKGYNVNNNERFGTNDKDYSLYTYLNYIPNPAAYENICEDESAVRMQQKFFNDYPEISRILSTYFEWSVDMINFYPINPSDLTIRLDDGTEQSLTLYDCFHMYTIIIKPKESLLEELYDKYNIPSNIRVSWAFNKEIPSYGYKSLVQWLCNPLNIVAVSDRLTEDETSFYKVFGGGLR